MYTYKQLAEFIFRIGYSVPESELLNFCDEMLGENREYSVTQYHSNSRLGNVRNFLKGVHLGLKIAFGRSEGVSLSSLFALLSSHDESDFSAEYEALKLNRSASLAKIPVGNRISRDELFMNITRLVGLRSTCLRAKVGALIVKEGRIISMGYNGPASGLLHCVDCSGAGCTLSLHAESNAVSYAARSGVSIEGATLYCSLSPCPTCAKIIIQSGIKEVVYGEAYRDTSGLELLSSLGILVREVKVNGRY